MISATTWSPAPGCGVTVILRRISTLAPTLVARTFLDPSSTQRTSSSSSLGLPRSGGVTTNVWTQSAACLRFGFAAVNPEWRLIFLMLTQV